jgi:hypothetical protein
MGAIKEALYESVESVFDKHSVEIQGEEVSMVGEVFDIVIDLLDGDAEALRDREQYWFHQYSIDTADFLADWTFRITSAVIIFTGIGTTEDGLVGNSFASFALFYHLHPRRAVAAMQKSGLNDKAIQGIIYLMAGRLIDQNSGLTIDRFDYLDR